MANFWDSLDKKPNNINLMPTNQQPNFADFAKFAQSFKGNPQEEVMKLLNNGQMSKEQFEQLKQQANQFASVFNMFKK